MTPDPISINCAGTFGKIHSGQAVKCTMPPYSTVKWVIEAEDFNNGSQGRKGLLDPSVKPKIHANKLINIK